MKVRIAREQKVASGPAAAAKSPRAPRQGSPRAVEVAPATRMYSLLLAPFFTSRS